MPLAVPFGTCSANFRGACFPGAAFLPLWDTVTERCFTQKGWTPRDATGEPEIPASCCCCPALDDPYPLNCREQPCLVRGGRGGRTRRFVSDSVFRSLRGSVRDAPFSFAVAVSLRVWVLRGADRGKSSPLLSGQVQATLAQGQLACRPGARDTCSLWTVWGCAPLTPVHRTSYWVTLPRPLLLLNSLLKVTFL